MRALAHERRSPGPGHPRTRQGPQLATLPRAHASHHPRPPRRLATERHACTPSSSGHQWSAHTRRCVASTTDTRKKASIQNKEIWLIHTRAQTTAPLCASPRRHWCEHRAARPQREHHRQMHARGQRQCTRARDRGVRANHDAAREERGLEVLAAAAARRDATQRTHRTRRDCMQDVSRSTRVVAVDLRPKSRQTHDKQDQRHHWHQEQEQQTKSLITRNVHLISTRAPPRCTTPASALCPGGHAHAHLSSGRPRYTAVACVASTYAASPHAPPPPPPPLGSVPIMTPRSGDPPQPRPRRIAPPNSAPVMRPRGGQRAASKDSRGRDAVTVITAWDPAGRTCAAQQHSASARGEY